MDDKVAGSRSAILDQRNLSHGSALVCRCNPCRAAFGHWLGSGPRAERGLSAILKGLTQERDGAWCVEREAVEDIVIAGLSAP